MSVEISDKSSPFIEILVGLGRKYSLVPKHPFVGKLNPHESWADTRLVFDAGVPKRLLTPKGSYSLSGPDLDSNIIEFLESLKTIFRLTEVSPRQNNNTSNEDYPAGYSGPIISLSLNP